MKETLFTITLILIGIVMTRGIYLLQNDRYQRRKKRETTEFFRFHGRQK